MEDLLLGVLVVVRTSNMKISRRRLADYVKKLQQKACRTCSRIFFLIQPIKLPFRELNKGRRQRYRRRQKTIGNLSNHDDGNKNVANLHIWQWKTVLLHALHVQFSSLDIWQTFSIFPRREMIYFAVVRRTWACDDKCSILSPYLWSTGSNLIPG